MSQVKILHGNNMDFQIKADLLFADPPFEIDGADVYRTILNYDCEHVILMCSIKQLLEFFAVNKVYKLRLDFIFDRVIPMDSKSLKKPNYI